MRLEGATEQRGLTAAPPWCACQPHANCRRLARAARPPRLQARPLPAPPGARTVVLIRQRGVQLSVVRGALLGVHEHLVGLRGGGGAGSRLCDRGGWGCAQALSASTPPLLLPAARPCNVVPRAGERACNRRAGAGKLRGLPAAGPTSFRRMHMLRLASVSPAMSTWHTCSGGVGAMQRGSRSGACIPCGLAFSGLCPREGWEPRPARQRRCTCLGQRAVRLLDLRGRRKVVHAQQGVVVDNPAGQDEGLGGGAPRRRLLGGSGGHSAHAPRTPVATCTGRQHQALLEAAMQADQPPCSS